MIWGMTLVRVYDSVVIGAGVAGMTAAIYLKRANIDVLIVEKNAPGGQVNNTSKIDNYPGLPGIEGPELSMNIYKQITDLKIEYQYGDVVDIIDSGDFKTIKTNTSKIKTQSIIIASGRVPKLLGLDNEQKLIGRGIGFCALCDGYFYKDKTVAVIGGGNSALEEALYLSSICKEIYLIHRRDSFSGDKSVSDMVKERENIKILYNSTVEEINDVDNKLDNIVINNNGINQMLKIDGMFIYIGYKPDAEFIKNLNIETSNGYINVDSNMRTNISGIYACGDIIKKGVYQIATALGDAAIAATSAKKDMV